MNFDPKTFSKIAAVRADSIVGNGTCSVIDECFTDEELAKLVSAARSPKGAVTKARQHHRTFHQGW